MQELFGYGHESFQQWNGNSLELEFCLNDQNPVLQKAKSKTPQGEKSQLEELIGAPETPKAFELSPILNEFMDATPNPKAPQRSFDELDKDIVAKQLTSKKRVEKQERK